MAGGIGETLRKARNRRKLPLFEIEAEIKIRVRYLRALEAEEWDALPDGSYARSFIRTYANYLGLDGDRLAGEFGQAPPAAGERGAAPVAARRPRGAAPGARHGRLLAAAVVFAVIAVAIAAIALIGGGSSTSTGGGGGAASASEKSAAGKPQAPPSGRSSSVELRLQATAEVWVCVLDAKGRALVDGQVLPSGSREGPFHSGTFTVAFGNGEIAMSIDGKQTQIPESASPLGYEIGRNGGLTALSEAERPTCV